MTAIDFDKYVNHKLKTQTKFSWLNKCGSKARKKILINAEMAFKNFFAAKSSTPQFKHKTAEDITLYFPKNNAGDWIIKRHKIKIPTLKYVRLKEFGYLPVDSKVINGTVSSRAGRYYVSVTVEQQTEKYITQIECVALNIRFKELDKIKSPYIEMKNVNRIYKKLYISQHKLQRKYDDNCQKKLSHNLEKQRLQVQRLKQKLDFIKNDYLNKNIAEIIALKPEYIVMEKFDMEKMVCSENIKRGMARQRYYDFKNRLLIKCKKYDLKLQEVQQITKEANLILNIDIA